MTALARTALQYYARYFPVSKGKNKLVDLLWKPLSFGQYKCTTTLQGSGVKMNCDVTQFIQRHLYFWGAYEPEHCNLWMNLAKRANVIFDVGANVGLYSLLAATTNPLARIHAFEPSTEVAEIFEHNIQLNRLKNIQLNRMALGATSGQSLLRECRGSDGTNEGMNYLVTDSDLGAPTDRLVPVTSIDDYCTEHGIEQIDLFKMDIEGGEHDALLGARNLLKSKTVRCLFVEFTDWAAKRSGHSTVELGRLLLDRGYLLYRLRQGILTEITFQEMPDGENVIAFASLDLVRLACRGAVVSAKM